MSTADDLLSQASCAQVLKQSEGVLDKILYRGLPFSPAVAPLAAHMPAVDEYRENLLQPVRTRQRLPLVGTRRRAAPHTRTSTGGMAMAASPALAESVA